MSEEDVRTLDLLRTLDRLPGPDHLEFPKGFDHERAASRAARLGERLSEVFDGPCSVDRTQDASCYFTVDVPPRLTEAQEWIGVRLSNYGDLAVVTAPELAVEDRRRVEAELSGAGYVLVPERLLRRPYDGVTWLNDEVPGPNYGLGRATWWTRFFDYL
ncbi:hypothetical protein [Streptomyces boluensis]|uniref:Uncharacterized protein n=1 Tax=Streptomyces boluensis TaxID=1775135 RepID=A0A964UPB1_9ACTN|nr:hypothetical protein [Streptomyces boluensis]NBE52938.1 hypothetical protein [Streptomyces boluensis]